MGWWKRKRNWVCKFFGLFFSEVKGQITEIMRLEEEGLNMNHTLEELRKR